MRSYGKNSLESLLFAAAAVTLMMIGSGALDASSPITDEIKRLPGAEKLKITFSHYSGFLKASEKHLLHYWFVESQGNVASDPVIFWFNGGPGCSSLDGLLNEMGPYVVNDDGATLRNNPNSWNKFASVVYIEAPAGVGYSYATDQNIKTDDDQTSADNYNAVKQFFTKFPSFRNHSVYIMGESYGGIYVPTLAARIIDGQSEFPLNLKGIALGNGYVSEVLNIETSIRFAYGHGVVDEKLWITLENECCGGCADTCDFTHLKKAYCSKMVQDIFNFLWTGGLNPYDLYRDCNPNASASHIRLKAIRNGLTPLSFKNRQNFESIDLKQQPSGLFAHLNGHVKPSYGDAPCMNDSAVIQYMNKENVREALHIPSCLGKWDLCSEQVTATYVKTYTDMTPFIRKLIGANVNILLFYGDTDMACNFLMGQQFAANLQQPLRRGKQPWRFNDQIAGFKTVYRGLTFLTVRGAGHMAAQWRAPQMQHAIHQFLLNEPI